MFLHKAQALRATAQPRAWHPLREVTTLSVDDTDQAASRRHNSSYTGIRASLQADQPGAEQGGRLTLCPPPAMQQKSGLGPKLEGSANSSVPETGSRQHGLRVKLPMRPKPGAVSHETASFAQPTNQPSCITIHMTTPQVLVGTISHGSSKLSSTLPGAAPALSFCPLGPAKDRPKL